MNRRQLLAGLAALPTTAYGVCRDTDGTPNCSRYLNFRVYDSTPQHDQQQCWTACIESVLRHHGMMVNRDMLTYKTEETAVGNLLANLNGPGTDYFGQTFHVHAKHHVIDPELMLEEIVNNRPMITGSMQHPVVLTGLQFKRYDDHSQVLDATVYDPWQGTVRSMGGREYANMDFAASFKVRF